MKKTINLAICFLAVIVAGLVYAAQDSDLTQRQVRDPRLLETILEANASDAETRLAAAETKVAQSDTNATTTATSYTPAYIGQVLVGSAGTGTNAVWISKGTTTNDWVQVAP